MKVGPGKKIIPCYILVWVSLLNIDKMIYNVNNVIVFVGKVLRLLVYLENRAKL
jgi:hypothetical protein